MVRPIMHAPTEVQAETILGLRGDELRSQAFQNLLQEIVQRGNWLTTACIDIAGYEFIIRVLLKCNIFTEEIRSKASLCFI